MLRSLEIGQPAFAPSAAFWNFDLSPPAILTVVVRWLSVMVQASPTFSKLTSALVSMLSGVIPSLARNSDSAIEKHAAWAAAYGLGREEALRAVTLYPAQILGIADRIGALAVGMDADLIVTTGDPLEVVTDVVYEFIQGRAVPLDSKHTRSYDKFRQRPK